MNRSFGLSAITYKNPFQNRRNTRSQKLFTRLETTVAVKAASKVGIKVFLRPFVSARNPQRKDDKITPAYPIALRMPFSLEVIGKSHSAIDSTRFTEDSSMKAQAIKLPARNMTM